MIKTETYSFKITDSAAFIFKRNPEDSQVWFEHEDQDLIDSHFKRKIDVIFDVKSSKLKLQSKDGLDIFGFYPVKKIEG